MGDAVPATAARQLTRRQIVRLHGPLTAVSAATLLDLLRSAQPAPAEVEVDLSRVTSIDRSGATGLLDAYVATVLRRRAFAVSGPTPDCHRSLRHLGVLDVVELLNARRPVTIGGLL